jgi:transposase
MSDHWAPHFLSLVGETTRIPSLQAVSRHAIDRHSYDLMKFENLPDQIGSSGPVDLIAFYADWIRELARQQEHGQTFRRNEIAKTRSASARICTERNLIKRFFNKIKQYPRIASRYDKLAANYLAFVKLASIWRRADESAS